MERFTKRKGKDIMFECKNCPFRKHYVECFGACEIAGKYILANIEDVFESIPDGSNELADKLKDTIEKAGAPW